MSEIAQAPLKTTEPVSTTKSKVQSLEEKIAVQREKLRKLEDEKKEFDRKERERNEKATIELLRTEKMLALSIDQWEKAMPIIRKALKIAE